jgi:hypothetical protein
LLRRWKETSTIRKVNDVLGIAVYFERRSSCGRDYPIERWQSLVRAFAVDKFFIIDCVRLPCFQPESQNLVVVDSLDEIDFPGDHIFVDNLCPPNRTLISLDDFVHPDDALYVFGADAGGLKEINHKLPTDRPGAWIHINTNTNHSIWTEQAAAITLRERYRHFHADY